MEVQSSFIKEVYKTELQNLLVYVYQSKISFLVLNFMQNESSGKYYNLIKELAEYYNTKLPK
jgi:hypothetical protein